MRPIREYPPARHLTGGDDPDARWQQRTCAGDNAWLFDYEHHGETTGMRRQRHQEAKAMCADCPALDLCQRQSFPGAAGVIAGRVVTP